MALIYILKSSIVNVILLIITFLAFGFVFSIIERKNNKFIYSTFGRSGLIVTGAIGTIIHELSHLIMCLIFRHHIKEVKLFRPIESEYDGVLGYVSHTYKKNSLYQKLGNFFIGIAPLIGGTLSIILIFRLFLPESFSAIINILSLETYIANIESFNFIGFINSLLKDIYISFTFVFQGNNLISLKFIIFIFLMYSISSHMSLSYSDFKNSLSGLGVLIAIVFIGSIVSYLLGAGESSIVDMIIEYNIIVILLMMLGLFFSFVTLIISYILSTIIKGRS
ncbi:hypothetical protein [Metaclostridioides mangenotii]|uniref:hypothetical protein n=1 Tax=Metaclostridioides mangenotii TaxID=1540 RepID=UPI00056E1205|nr:hypothetical protein [Clostridioides mangenotii]